MPPQQDGCLKDDNDFLYVESKRVRTERERDEKIRRQHEIDFSPQDLALATVPGLEFDPRERSFAPDELRPQPIIRKRKKVKYTASSRAKISLKVNRSHP